jgi:hypothetical protein
MVNIAAKESIISWNPFKAFTSKRPVSHPELAPIADAGLADLFDAGFQCALIGATGFVMIG